MKYLKWLWPLFILIPLIPFTPKFDIEIERFFYTPGINGEKGHFVNNIVTIFFFRYGEIIGIASGALASAVFCFTFLNHKLKRYRRGALSLVLTLVLGAGILTNALFKEYWGRPRPIQLTEFGGNLEYRPFWHPNFSSDRESQKSFPSGHVAMGFYYLSVCLVARKYKNKPFYFFGLGLTLFFGLGEIFSRLAQGGHFFSDALCSFVLMWIVSLAVNKWVFANTYIGGKEGCEDFLPKISSQS